MKFVVIKYSFDDNGWQVREVYGPIISARKAELTMINMANDEANIKDIEIETVDALDAADFLGSSPFDSMVLSADQLGLGTDDPESLAFQIKVLTT